MNSVAIICMIIAFLILPVIFIIGMINPYRIIPAKFNVKNRKQSIFLWTLILFFLFTIIGGNNLPDKNISNTDQKSSTNFENQNTISIPTDSAIIITYKPKFDSLYLQLMRLDTIVDEMSSSRTELHQQIQDLLFNKWWGVIEKFDSLKHNVVLSKKVYKQCAKKYDKQYGRFLIYGDEDRESIKSWAESEGQRILKKLVRDPKSLVIEEVTIKGKTKKGWNCKIIYRATNGFGGYEREYITLIMAYDNDNKLYKCVSVQ